MVTRPLLLELWSLDLRGCFRKGKFRGDPVSIDTESIYVLGWSSVSKG